MTKATWFYLLLSTLIVRSLADCPHRRLLAEVGSGWQPQSPHATNESDKLVVVNDQFHARYSETNRVLQPRPLILIENDYLVVWRGDGDERKVLGSFTPDEYHDLKMFCHIPLAIVTIGLSSKGDVLDAATASRLQQYLSKLEEAKSSNVAARFALFTKNVQEAQQEILTTSMSFAHQLLDGKVAPTVSSLEHFAAPLCLFLT